MKVKATKRFDTWLRELRDKLAKASIIRRIERLKDGNFGDSKSLGGGVFELRIDCGQGYRVYFKNDGGEVIVLLAGGSKRTQSADIVAAKELAKEV